MPSYMSYLHQMAVLDKDDDIEAWITVRGNHIPIKKGQSKEDAVKEFIKSKGGNAEKGSNTKSELSVIYHKEKGHIKEGRPPKDWQKVEGALTAPNGYSWYSNGKSMFGGERETYLYKDEPEKKPFMSEKEYASVKKNTEHILKKAYESEPKITGDLKSIKGIKLIGLDYRRKAEKSAVEKVKRERIESPEENGHKTDEQIMNSMWDLVRYTQEVDKDKFVEQVRKTLSTLESKGYKIYQLKNFWRPEVNKGKNPYRGINMKMLSPDGQKFELQFNTKNNLDVKEKMHQIYNKQREYSPNSKEFEELNKESLKLTKLFDNPKDVESLVVDKKD